MSVLPGSLPTLTRPGLKFGLVLLLLFISVTSGFFVAYTSQRDAVADFYIEWRGSQIALQGGNPYSQETTQAIQLGSKGRLLGPEEDQLAFVYPYWRVFYSAPLAYLPYEWASALWLGFLLTAYVASLYLLTLAVRWRPASPLQAVVFYAVLLGMFPAFSALMLGQSALLGAALLGIAYYCLKNEMPGWAGIALALATVKPQLVLVVAPWLLVRAAWRRQWRVLIGFGATLTGLVALSFAFYPAWFEQFLLVAARYPAYKKSLTGPGFLLEGLGSLGGVLAAGLWLMLAIVAVGLWLAEARPARSNIGFDRAFCLALLLTLWLPPQTNISNPVILALPLVWLLAQYARTGGFYLFAAGLLTLSWLFYFLLFNNFYGWLIIGWPIIIGGLGLTFRKSPATET